MKKISKKKKVKNYNGINTKYNSAFKERPRREHC